MDVLKLQLDQLLSYQQIEKNKEIKNNLRVEIKENRKYMELLSFNENRQQFANHNQLTGWSISSSKKSLGPQTIYEFQAIKPQHIDSQNINSPKKRRINKSQKRIITNKKQNSLNLSKISKKKSKKQLLNQDSSTNLQQDETQKSIDQSNLQNEISIFQPNTQDILKNNSDGYYFQSQQTNDINQNNQLSDINQTLCEQKPQQNESQLSSISQNNFQNFLFQYQSLKPPRSKTINLKSAKQNSASNQNNKEDQEEEGIFEEQSYEEQVVETDKQVYNEQTSKKQKNKQNDNNNNKKQINIRTSVNEKQITLPKLESNSNKSSQNKTIKIKTLVSDNQSTIKHNNNNYYHQTDREIKSEKTKEILSETDNITTKNVLQSENEINHSQSSNSQYTQINNQKNTKNTIQLNQIHFFNKNISKRNRNLQYENNNNKTSNNQNANNCNKSYDFSQQNHFFNLPKLNSKLILPDQQNQKTQAYNNNDSNRNKQTLQQQQGKTLETQLQQKNYKNLKFYTYNDLDQDYISVLKIKEMEKQNQQQSYVKEDIKDFGYKMNQFKNKTEINPQILSDINYQELNGLIQQNEIKEIKQINQSLELVMQQHKCLQLFISPQNSINNNKSQISNHNIKNQHLHRNQIQENEIENKQTEVSSRNYQHIIRQKNYKFQNQQQTIGIQGNNHLYVQKNKNELVNNKINKLNILNNLMKIRSITPNQNII